MTTNITQLYFPYWLWEEHKFGMWRYCHGNEREKLFKQALEFTGDYKLYGKYMIKAVTEWKYSIPMALTNPSINHQAFVGHAACCIAIKCPEDITRQAWHYLTVDQQNLANNEADKAIIYWWNMYRKGFQPCLKLA